MDPQNFAIAAFAVTFAGISKGGFGGGTAFAASAILALVLDPAEAIGLMLPLLMIMDVGALRSFWRKWDWGQAKVMMIGGLPGVAIGAFFYEATDDDMLRLLIGIISLAFVGWHILPKTTVQKTDFSQPIGLVAGVVSGFTSFLCHAGGPPASIYLLSQRLDKTQYHATMSLVFWLINAVKVIPYAFLGIFTLQTLFADVILTPFALLGVWLGVRAHYLISDLMFFRLMYLLLTLTGMKLISDALT